MKKLISAFLALVLCLSFLSVCTFSAAADGTPTPENMPANTVIVYSEAGSETTTVAFADKVYNVVYDSTVFNTLAAAIEACPADGTILLCPGNYTDPAIFLTKNVTIKGPGAGINPNVKGENPDDPWTLNPLRSTDPTKEAIFGIEGASTNGGQIYPGHSGTASTNDDFHLTIDGVVFAGRGFIRSAYFGDGKETITLKNVISYKTNAFSLVHSVCDWAALKTTNTRQRYITIEDYRAIDCSYAVFGNISAEQLTIKGAFLDETCKADCLWGLYTTAEEAGTDPVSFTIEESFFCCKAVSNNRIFNLTLRDNAYQTFNEDVGKKESVTVNVKNNVFYNCAYNGDSKVLQVQCNTQNVYFNITGNTFKQTGETIPTYRVIEDYSNVPANMLASHFVIDDNTFDNVVYIAKFSCCTGRVQITKSLYIDAEGKVGIPQVWPDTPATDTTAAKTYLADMVSYYTNKEKTNFKNADGSEPVIRPEDLKTFIKAIPEGLFTAPVAGEMPETTANIPSGAAFSAESVKWYTSENKQTYTIKAGQTYTAAVTLLSPSNLLTFKEGQTTIPAEYTYEIAADGRSITVKQTFTLEGGETTAETETKASEKNTETAEKTGEKETKAAEEEPAAGCASSVAAGALILVALCGAVLSKKH